MSLKREPPRGGVGGAAALILAGQLTGRLLGFVQESITAALFGQGGGTDAFFAAERISQQVYDLLVGSTITAALVPIFSQHADDRDRSTFWHLARVILTFGALLMIALAVLAVIFARQVVSVVVQFHDPATEQLAVSLARIVMPSFLFLGLSGIVASLLNSMRIFVYSGFVGAAMNATIVTTALVFHRPLGVASLAVGMLVGSALMVGLQLPALLHAGMRFRPSLDLRHPEVRRMGRLYLPVAVGMIATIVQAIVDSNLASRTGEGSISAMQYATKIIQLPLGLIAIALGTAILPTLSRHALDPDLAAYKAVLSRGIRLVLALILPMAALVLVLNNQVLALVYQHGRYTPADRQLTSLALYLYTPELPFAAVDTLLIAAFYAMKNTLVPALIGVLGVGVYLMIALSLVGRYGMPALVIANTAKDSMHGVVLMVLLWRAVRGLPGQGLATSTGKVLLAAAAAGLVALIATQAMGGDAGLGSLRGQLIALAVPAALGGLAYVACTTALGVDEVRLGWRMLLSRVRA